MSATDGKWQIGVAAAYQTFDNFDRPAKVGADFAAMPIEASSDGSGPDTYLENHDNYNDSPEGLYIDLESDLATDYEESPFFLSEKKLEDGSYIPGSELIVGPSSDAVHSGAVERCFVNTVIADADGDNVRVVQELGFDSDLSNVHVAVLTSAYKAGDPVMIRTIPLGWTTSTDFSAAVFGVRPIGRYANGSNLAFLAQPAGSPNITGMPDVNDRERRHGMEVVVHENTENTNRYVQYVAPVNSFIPTVRRWRVSWDRRIQRAHYGSIASPSGITAKAILGLTAADGTLLFPIRTEAGNTESGTTSDDLDGDGVNDLTKSVRTYTASDVGDEWVNDSFLASHTSITDTDNDWSFATGLNSAVWNIQNRANRWWIRFSLEAGKNTALGIDNLVFEHAHGTSGEANGFYEINDWPEIGSLAMTEVSTQRSSTRLSNGAMKVAGKTVSRPRWRISADFSNVDVSIYRDLLVLLEWQRQNHPLVLRPFGTPLPTPLVGVMSIERWSPQLWNSDGIVSFTLNFEEI